MTRSDLAGLALVVCSGSLVLSACSSSGGTAGPTLPSAAAFSPGPCQRAAPALLAIVRRADKGGQVGHLDLDLTAQQSVLRQLPSQTSGIQDVVTAIGFLRLRVDAHSYADQARQNVGSAARRAVAGCTRQAH
jgi:hypothetical protein